MGEQLEGNLELNAFLVSAKKTRLSLHAGPFYVNVDLFSVTCKNSTCLIISELQCFVGLISPPQKMSQNRKSKEDNIISLSFCVVFWVL